MPTRPLPNDPSLEHLRKDAKRFVKAVRAGDAEAVSQVKEFHPNAEKACERFALNDAQLVTARLYGFTSWTKLKQHLAAIEPFVWSPPPPPRADSLVDVFITQACLTYDNWHRSNPAKALALLEQHPELAAANIYAAAAAGNVPAIAAMLDRDPALLNAKGGPVGWAPLLYACYSRFPESGPDRSSLEAARLLLTRGADPNAGFLWSGTYLFTALTGAFGRGEDNLNQPPHPQWRALATLLLESGADPNDSQALYNRHFEENDDHLTLLFSYGLGTETHGPWLARLGDRLGTPAQWLVQELCWAAEHGYVDRVRLLVDHGVDVNRASQRDGRTAYEQALRAGHQPVVGYLAQHGARTIDLDPVETFALACIAGRRDEAMSRLAQDPELLNKLGRTGQADLIHRAVGASSHDGIRLIVEFGVDVNALIPDTGLDRTPLHNAAAGGDVETMKLLIELGADPHVRDQPYRAKPIGWADHCDQPDAVSLLLQFATIFDAVSVGAFGHVAERLRRDPPLADARDESGNPLIFYTWPHMTRRTETLEALVSHGVDVNARDKGGHTLLDRAMEHGQAEFADLLRAHGAKRSTDLM